MQAASAGFARKPACDHSGLLRAEKKGQDVEKSGESSGKRGEKGSSGKRAGKEVAHVFPNDLERGDVGRHGHHFDRPIFVKRKGGSP